VALGSDFSLRLSEIDDAAYTANDWNPATTDRTRPTINDAILIADFSLSFGFKWA